MEIVLLFAGLILILLGVVICNSELKERRGTEIVRGTVIGFSQGQSSSGRFLYAVAEYSGADGRRRYVESSVGSSAPTHSVGDRVALRVSPTEPGRAAFQSHLTLIVGLVMLLMGLGCIVLFRRIFQWTAFSLVAAAAISLTMAFKLKSLMRKEPLTVEAWQALKAKTLRPKLFDDESKKQITWADPAGIAAATAGVEKSRRVAVPLLFVFGLGFLLLSRYLYVNTARFLEKADHADGVVVDLKQVDSRDSTTWAPVIEFVDPSGGRRRFVERMSSNPPSYYAGERVDVLFNRENPRDARIDRGRGNQWVAILVGSMGGLFLLMGFSSMKRRRGTDNTSQ
jgi:hypothetical protein